MLVAQGAYTFAVANDVPTCDTTALVAPRCIAEWEHWKKMLADSSSHVPPKELLAQSPMQDTVGAISWDLNGTLAAGVSRFTIAHKCKCSYTDSLDSGGLLLKYSGRIGEVSGLHDRLDVPLKRRRPQFLVPGAGLSRTARSASHAVYQVL
jgi:isoaspartyl peptidase/L-asparaginase-like protein (Ntn-hydrolase superfamily)